MQIATSIFRRISVVIAFYSNPNFNQGWRGAMSMTWKSHDDSQAWDGIGADLDELMLTRRWGDVEQTRWLSGGVASCEATGKTRSH